jgi:acetyl esterase/lipase
MSDENYNLKSDIPYVEDGDTGQVLDIFLPKGQSGPYPVLFTFHGGGGDKTDFTDFAKYFVNKGYAVVSSNRRDMPQHNYPLPVQDAFNVLSWALTNSETLGFDTDKLIAVGHSSGGTLAAMLGAAKNPWMFFQDYPQSLPDNVVVKGVVTFTGIFEFAADEKSEGLQGYFKDYFGGEYDLIPEIWNEASPINHIDGDEPPMLLVHDEMDTGVIPAHSSEFAAALKDAGVNAKLLLIPDGSHMSIIQSDEPFAEVATFLDTLFA